MPNALPPPQPEPSDDTQVGTTPTSVTGLRPRSQEEHLATKVVVYVNPSETNKIACAPEMREMSNAHKVFNEFTKMNASSPKEVAVSGALRKNSYIFIEENKAGDSSTDKIGHVRKMWDELIHIESSLAWGEKI